MLRRWGVPVFVALLVGCWIVPVSIAAKSLPLSARLIKAGEFKAGGSLGTLNPSGRPTLYRSAKAWQDSDLRSDSQTARYVASLRRDGFKALLSEFLGSQDGLSWVMQLGSSASARSALAATFRYDTAPSGGQKLVATFTDAAVPGSRGYEVSGNGGHGANILFADGPFVYLVGEGWSDGSTAPPRSGLLAALTHLYKRVH